MTAQAGRIRLGFEDGYDWLVATCSLSDLLSACPEIVSGKYVAVTAFDSGPLVPTEEERANGWHSQFGIAYSPRVADPRAIPHDNCYDEWYVLNEPTVIGRIAEQQANIFEKWQTDDTVFRFVNYHLGLHLESQKPLADLFWMQIRRIKPEVYVADSELRHDGLQQQRTVRSHPKRHPGTVTGLTARSFDLDMDESPASPKDRGSPLPNAPKT